MTDTLAPLIHDLLEWIAARPRTYAEVMDAWRTSCPRLTVWEDANERGLVVRTCLPGQPPSGELTQLGRRFLESR